MSNRLKACRHSLQRHDESGDIDHGGEGLIGLVVACGDLAILVETANEIFDQMAPSIHRKVVRDKGLSVGLGRDYSESAAFVEFRA